MRNPAPINARPAFRTGRRSLLRSGPNRAPGSDSNGFLIESWELSHVLHGGLDIREGRVNKVNVNNY
jgi:hypothetical protein